MAIKIITDSTSDIAFDRQEELGIKIVSLSVRFGDKEYVDGVDLTKPQFFQMLRESAELPTTAQVNPERFEKIFAESVQNGDEVIGIFISSKLSGTYQSAVIAKQMLGAENIHLIDSLSVSFGLALLVYEMIKLRDAGKSAPEICSAVKELKKRQKFYAIIDTLKYLKMGGRLSASSAFIGSMLHIKPIIAIENGEIKAFDKKKGHKAAAQRIAEMMEQEKPDSAYRVFFGDSDAQQFINLLKDAVESVADISDSETVALGSVVGTHGGPGCVGISYIAQEHS
ncbi:DegV family protein [Caproiciproducens faecalis]|uniref:DegV family protein n=1 Tax=Caproiciproducens faecalis TaxID=2820301 RepID=A0ABS7DNW6_9FIRM|nr:DegV family protein [Caproiciproducens faecalis]MBW7572998.1 DegV family protein [Caproiciproducens faecalis]